MANKIVQLTDGDDNLYPITVLDGVQTDTYFGSWTADTSSANNTQLTQSITVPSGYYVLVLKAPAMSTTGFSVAISINGTNHNQSVSFLAPYNEITYIVKLTNSTNSIYGISTQSATCNFTSTERGGIQAIRVSSIMGERADVDYIVDEGTSTVSGVTWTYRKWNSGKAECWCTAWYNNLTINRQYGAVYLPAADNEQGNINFPFTFTARPVITKSVDGGNQWILGSGDVSTTNTGTFWICRPASGTNVTVGVSIYAIGTWK